MVDKEFLSTAEVAAVLGISRIAVFKKIKSGEIKAVRVGRSFVVRRNDILEIAGKIMGPRRKEEIESAVDRAIKNYGEAIKKLGEE